LIFCTLPNPAIDFTYPVETFTAGGTLLNVPSRMFPSGKGINVAHAVRTLGEEVCVVGIMPERDQRRFEAYLDAKEIQHDFYTISGDVRTNVTIIEQKSGMVSHLNSVGPVVPVRVQEEFVQFVSGHFKRSDEWCFSGSIPSDFEDDVYAQLIRAGKEAGVSTFLDTRGRPLRLGVRARPLSVKPNIAELEDLFGEHVKGVRHIALKGKKLLDRGVSFAFITLGSDGLIALHDSDCLLCVPPQVKSADTVGCGDALMGGLLVAWSRKFSFTEMCRLAIACGASKAMHEGPHSVSRDEVWQLMEDVKITAV
jgi:1-phosphofructokinase family hexose kinase